MIHIKSPMEYAGRTRRSIFLAGGITNCPDWQADTVISLRETGYALFNPRRDDFDVTDPLMEEDQIEWEHHYLQFADMVLFWFPKETLCPITLYELGIWVTSPKRLLIGCERGYARERDIRIQVGLERGPSQHIYTNLEEMVGYLL